MALHIAAIIAASPSSQRAWIEILTIPLHGRQLSVALLAEGVDRNIIDEASGVDDKVALLAEGVDRNGYCKAATTICRRSPSSQRAWIEISAG